jgi:hypothetical protein
MPGRHAHAGTRILEGLVLQPRGVESELASYRQQQLLIRADEVHHRLIIDPMAV